MEVHCTNCGTRYSVADHLVKGRRGRFPCRNCPGKVLIDGTKAPTGAAALSSVGDEEDEATRMFTTARPSRAAPPAPDLADAIDEEEATRIVTLIDSGKSGQPEPTEDFESEYTHVLASDKRAASTPDSDADDADDADDDATRIHTKGEIGAGDEKRGRTEKRDSHRPPARMEGSLGPEATVLVKPEAPIEQRQRVPTLSGEHTSPGRAGRAVASPKGPAAAGSLIRVLLLVIGGGLAGYALSQFVNSQKSEAPAPTQGEVR